MRTKLSTLAGSLIATAAVFLALTPFAHATTVESITLGSATTTCNPTGLTTGTGTICLNNTTAYSLTALENGTQTLNAVVGSTTTPTYLVTNDTTTTTATFTFSGTAAAGVPLSCKTQGTYSSSLCAITGNQGAAITGGNYGPPSAGWSNPIVAQISFTAIPVGNQFDVIFSTPGTADTATLSGPCYGSCQVAPTCSAGQTTTITGTVYVPNGTDPLPNALVYIPSAAPDPLTPGVQCLVAGTEATGSPVAETHTAVDGTFTLTGVPTGTNIPIVIESGKWRMQGTVQTVTGCTNNVAPAWATTFPSTHMQGDIPKMALVTGNVDSLECVLRKTGLNDAEFDNPGGTGQVDFYKGSGDGGAVINSSTPSQSTLTGSATTLAKYDMVMFPCQGGEYNQSSSDLANVYNYANIGGRLFTTHFSYVWLYNNPSSTTGFGTAATWDVNLSDPAPDPGMATVNTNFTGGSTLSQWLQNAGASSTLSQIEISTLRLDQTGVVAPTQSWLTLNTNTTSSDKDANPVMQMTFNTPVGAPAAAQCGRVLFNEYHVENNNGDNGDTFPSECAAGAMTPQEKLLEYALFDLSTAITPVVAPTVSQSYVNYSSTTTPNTDFTQGDNGDTITADVTNTSSTVSLASSIVFTATLPTGVTATSMTDPTGGWTCTVATLTCTRTTPIPPSGSDSIIITTDVAANAPLGTVDSMTSTISGGGLSSNVSDADQLDILGAQPQAITFNPTTPVTYGVSPITLTATGGACSTPVTFSIVSGNGTLSGTNDDILTVTGTGPIVVAANQAGCTGYTAAPTVDKTITVNPAVLTVSAQPASKTYGAANPAFTDVITGFVNGDTSAVVSGTASLTTTATTGSGVGSYAITAGQGSLSASNYTFVYSPSTLTVNPAVLTVTANNATKTYGSANPAFTDTITGFVNGDNSSVVSGAASLTTTAVTSSPVGSYPITAAKGTLAASNYTFTYVPGTLTVTPAAGAISWPTPAAITYGNPFTSAQIDPSATCGGVTVPGTWSWSPSNPLGQTLNAGTYSYTATFTPTDTTDCPVEQITDSLVVNPAVLTVTASNASKTYGAANPTLSDTITGFVNGDTSSVVTGAASLSTTATTSSAAGSYPITAAQGTLAASNYTFVYAPGTLTVNKAVLTVAAQPASKTYGSANPSFTDVITGYVNGDNSSVVSGTASLTTTATTGSGVGSYPITAAQGSLSAANYTFAYTPSTLTVNPAVLNVAAQPASKTYGSANPAFTDVITGFVNGDNSSVVSGAASLSTTATTGSGVGSYPITAAQGSLSAANYTFAYSPSTLTVNPATLTVTAQNATRGYGVANPVFTDTITGFVNGDTSSVVSGSASLTTTAGLTSPAGTYPITAAQGSLAASNYNFTFVNGTLTVAQAAGAISWPTPAAITYGTPLSSTQLDAAATCGGETVPGTYVYTPLLNTVEGAGTHTLSVTFTPTDTADCPTETTTVSLTVNPAVLTVAAQTASKTYGAANPTFTDVITGFVNGDNSSVVTGTASLTTTATTGSPAGSYPITAAQGSLAAANYTFVYTPSTLTVNPAVLTVTANNATRAYGVANPVFTDTITGFVNGDNSSVVSGAASLTTTAGPTSPAGPYTITAAAGTLAATNYTFTYVNGTLTVTPQSGSISWATPAAITYGTPLSATQLNAVAMCDGSVATGTYVYTPPATTVLDAGTHTLSVAFTPSNPGVCPAESTTVNIVVNPAPQTITFTTPSSEPYGSAPLTLNGTGGASGNPVTYTVTGPATLSGNVLTFTGWGTVTVTANQAGNTDYTAATPVTQTILVTQPPVSTNVVLSLSNEVFTYPGEANVTVCVSVTSNVAATGMMQIFDNGVLLTTQPLQGGGCAYWYIQPGLNAGPHAFSAYYLGDSVNPPGYSNTVAFTVSLFPTVLEVNCWNPSFAYGADYSCDANPDSGPLQGYVQYSINGAPAVQVQLNGSDHALWTIHEPPVGNYTMTIVYPQQGNYAAFALPTQTYTVTPAIDEVSFTPSNWSPSAGSIVTLSASVTSQSAGAPNAIGSVSFYDGSTLLAAVPVDSNGNANFTTTFTSGYHNLTATYSGANYSTNSTTINLQVQ